MIALAILTAVYAPLVLVLVFRVGMALEYDDTPTALIEGFLALYLSALLAYAWWTR